MKRMTPESIVLRDCIQWLYYKRIFVWRNNTGAHKTECGHYVKYGLPGSADIIGLLSPNFGVHAGRLIAIECKSEKGKLSESQIKFKERIEESGGLYILVKSTYDLEKALEPLISSPSSQPLD